MDKNALDIVCFAGLRKYFGNETTIFVETGASYSHVIDALVKIKPDAKDVLKSSRIVVNEEFVPANEKINPAGTIFLVPPSSGG